jgi:1-acyl-sn-glycerol-3-phosphate acyltransferase
MTVGIYGSLPIIVLRVVDHYIGSGPFSHLSEKMKRGIAWLMLELSGISVEIIDGPDKSQKQRKNFSESCSLLTFSHSSNLDGFLVSATCPIRHFALAKKELFMVPFFSWISLAFGGVPVDRSNRERAVCALHRASSAAKNNQICIVIAPEGMRSTTGQLLPFKKGTYRTDSLNYADKLISNLQDCRISLTVFLMKENNVCLQKEQNLISSS